MKRRELIVTIVLAMASVAGACVVSYNPKCPDMSTNCPDGTMTPDGKLKQIATCTSTDRKNLNRDVGSGSGNDTAPSSGTCNYSCTYVDGNGTSVNCGSTPVSWNGTQPGPNACQNGSGSGSGS